MNERKTEFNVGDLVQIGTVDDLPQGHLKPTPGRIICNDAVNPDGLPVMGLFFVDELTREEMRQFSAEGKCAQSTITGSPDRGESNLYHRDEPIT